MIPANFTARRYEDAHQAQALADWCGGTVHDGDTRLLPVILVPAGEGTKMVSPGDWIILAADGTVRTGRPGSQDGYCADCGQPVWWHDEQLVDRDTNRWCFGPGRTRVAMERWHALPGMHQFVAAAPAGQPCQCLVRSGPHVHQITDMPEKPAQPGWPDIRWAPFTDAGTPDPAGETEEPPAGPVVICATGYPDGHSVVYWRRPGEPYQRRTSPPCQACGTWTCAACGWQRSWTALDRPELQDCARCHGTDGSFTPTRHQQKTGLYEEHNPAAGPACATWDLRHKPFGQPCRHPSCRTITWKE